MLLYHSVDLARPALLRCVPRTTAAGFAVPAGSSEMLVRNGGIVGRNTRRDFARAGDHPVSPTRAETRPARVLREVLAS